MTQRHLGHMIWTDVAEAAKRDVPVLIPVGTLEMQGLFSPMGHDYIVAERLASAVADKVECLVAPTVNYGYSFFSKPVAGTISLRPETLRALLLDITTSLLQHGFRHLIFINNHGLNEPILGHVADEVREKHGVLLASAFPSKMAQDLSTDLFETQVGVFAHGGEPTISLMMYLTPDDMRLEGARRIDYPSPLPGFDISGLGAVKVGGSTINVYMDMNKIAPSGGGGDATQGSVEKGRIMFERMVDLMVDFVTRFRAVDM